MLSPIFKWLERRFILKLQSYLTNNLDRNQTGFVAGMGTHVNILLLVEKLRKGKENVASSAVPLAGIWPVAGIGQIKIKFFN
jgi:hypothetical protein